MDYSKLLLEHLDLVNRIVGYIARRHHLSASDAEEFASVVRLKLIDRDFAVLRKFQQRSNLATYLTTVVERLYLDFCISRWGKWRPSAAARRLGSTAIALEQLLTRDGLTFDEAVGTLQTNHHCPETRDELQAIAAHLPLRPSRRPANDDEIAAVASQSGALDSGINQSDDWEAAERVERALLQAVAALSPRDQLVLKLRFQDGCTVPEIGEILQLSPKPLYRQLHATIVSLRDSLRQYGIDERDIERVVGHPAITLGRVFATESSRAPGESHDASV